MIIGIRQREFQNINLIGYKYANLQENNYKEILKKTYENIQNSKNKENIFLKFGLDYSKEFIIVINKFVTDNPFILFCFSEQDNIGNDFFNKIKKPQYISYIKDINDPNDTDKMFNKIISFIWEKACYFNEMGNILCKFSPANLLYKKPKGFIHFKILLTGESRAGKSSFINRITNKLVSYETPKLESATNHITCYDFYDNDESLDEKDTIRSGFGGIRIFDSPGLVKNDNLDYKELSNKIKNEFDRIDIIFFFLKSQSNIENCIKLLKYIHDKNEENIKKGKNKIPIIFIKNGEEDMVDGGNAFTFFTELKNELKKHSLYDLYDSSINQNNKKENTIDDFFEEENENIEQYQNYIDGNIIQVNIIKGKNVNTIFKTTNQYFINYNIIAFNKDLNDEFIQMKNNSNQLIQLYIKEKLEKKALTKEEKQNYKNLYEQGVIFSKKLYNKFKILSDFEELYIRNTKENILVGLKMFGYIFLGSILGIIGTFGLSLLLIPMGFVIIPIMLKNEIRQIAIDYGLNKQDLDNYGLYQYILEINNSKDNDEKKKKKINNLFIKMIDYIGPVHFSIKAREAIFQIKEFIEKLSEKKENEWNYFKIEKI